MIVEAVDINCYLQIVEELPQRRQNSIFLSCSRKYIWLNTYRTHCNLTSRRTFSKVGHLPKRLASSRIPELSCFSAVQGQSYIFFTMLGLSLPPAPFISGNILCPCALWRGRLTKPCSTMWPHPTRAETVCSGWEAWPKARQSLLAAMCALFAGDLHPEAQTEVVLSRMCPVCRLTTSGTFWLCAHRHSQLREKPPRKEIRQTTWPRRERNRTCWNWGWGFGLYRLLISSSYGAGCDSELACPILSTSLPSSS